jgi:cytochrome c biogenesis protein CcmG/thiol:disulfide interchange protein DsbE
MISGRLLRLIPLLLAGLVVPVAFAGEPPAPDLNLIRARSFEVATLNGTAVPLTDLLVPGKPVLVEFWATWCVPCRKVLPHLVELNRRYRDQGLVVIGLNVEDPTADAEKVRRFTRDFGMDFQVAFAPPDLYRFMNHKQAISVPKVFLFDGNGNVAEYITSYTPFTNRRIESAVGKVMAASKR